MYLGLDLGTTALKAVVCATDQSILAVVEEPCATLPPFPGAAEQDPAAWIAATRRAVTRLSALVPDLKQQLVGVGLSGQMHTLVALDRNDHPLRPAILWNDPRGADFAGDAAGLPDMARITGVGAMSGFTAAKLHWFLAQEPRLADRLHRILLPKDYLRLWLTGEWASDASDAAGTQLFDQQQRDWSEPVMAWLGLPMDVLPPVLEGPAVAGRLRSAVAAVLGLPVVPVVCGGGDAATGALGTGCTGQGQAMISLGTGAVYLAADAGYVAPANPDLHHFAHCLPGRWYRMAALLCCGSAVEWVAAVTGNGTGADALGALEAQGWRGPGPLQMSPHLDGTRSVDGGASRRGAAQGLSRAVTGLDLVQAMLEGTCFALAAADRALRASGPVAQMPVVIGGGGRSDLWTGILATALDRPMWVAADAGAGSALGAVRLAMIGVSGASLAEVAVSPPGRVVEPIAAHRAAMRDAEGMWQDRFGQA